MTQRRRVANAFAAVGVALLLMVSCSGTDDATATGVVIDVQGDLTVVDRFTIRLPDGTDQVVEPAPGVLFHGDTAMGHIRDHLRSGGPVFIRYEVLDDGTWVALEVTDADE